MSRGNQAAVISGCCSFPVRRFGVFEGEGAYATGRQTLGRGPTLDGGERRLANFIRVQTFGTGDVYWVRVTVNPRDPNVFLFEPVIVEENRFPR